MRQPGVTGLEATLRRLPALLVMAVLLLLGGAPLGVGSAASPAPSAPPLASSAVTVQRSGGAASEAHQPAAPVATHVGRADRAAPSGPPLVWAPAAAAPPAPPLLTGQLPRPPPSPETSDDESPARGRAPPGTAGT